MNNLSTLIGSCDKYTPLLKTFQICFDRYWSLNTRNIIVTETIDVPNYTDTNFEVVKAIGRWGSRMLKALDKIDTDYVYFILDDYFLQYKHPDGTIERYIELMERHNIDRLQISPSFHQRYTQTVKDGLTKISDDSTYLISLQPSIWKKDFIYKTLVPSYDPWQYELKASEILKNSDNNVYIDRSAPMIYWNAVRVGMVKGDGWDKFFEREGLESIQI